MRRSWRVGASSNVFRICMHATLRIPQGNACDGAPVDVPSTQTWELAVSGIIYLVGLIVVIMAILSFLGLR